MIRPGERCGFPVLDKDGVVRTCRELATCERPVDYLLFPACHACAAVRDLNDVPDRDPLDPIHWRNPAAVTRWLGELVATWKDVDAVTQDMLRPARRRELGHCEHERRYREAAAKLAELLARAVSPISEEEDEHGDPAGMGGAGAE